MQPEALGVPDPAVARKVEALAGYGITDADIARVLRLDPPPRATEPAIEREPPSPRMLAMAVLALIRASSRDVEGAGP